jgi:hypothetical protein
MKIPKMIAADVPGLGRMYYLVDEQGVRQSEFCLCRLGQKCFLWSVNLLVVSHF